MNKAFKQFGKASFRSTIPRRIRVRNAWRTIRAHQAAMIGYSQLQNIRNAVMPTSAGKAAKTLAMAQCAAATNQAIAEIMRGDQ